MAVSNTPQTDTPECSPEHGWVSRLLSGLTLCAIASGICLGLIVEKSGSKALSVLALVGLVALLIPRERKKLSPFPKALKHWLYICTAVFCSAALSWWVNGLDPEQARALSSPIGKFLLTLLALPALLLCYRSHPKLFTQTVMASCIAGAIFSGFHALCEIFQWTIFSERFSHKTWRATGVVNAIYFGNIALTLGAISAARLHHYWKERQWGWLLFAAAGTTLGIMASVLSLSRGGWLAGLILIFLLAVFLLIRGKAKTLFIIFSLLLAPIIAGYNFAGKKLLEQRLEQTYEHIANFDPDSSQTSIGYRLRMWLQAIDNIKGSPIFGTGPDSFVFVDPDPSPSLSLSIESEYYHAHNDYLNTLSNTGIVGLIPFTLLYAAPFLFFVRAASFKAASQWPLLGAFTVILYAGFSLTDVMFYRSVGTIYFLLLTSLFIVLSAPHTPDESKGHDTKTVAA